MNRMRAIAIAVAVLLAGVAVAVVVFRGQAISPGPGDDFASDLERRPECWVKVKSSAPGTCPHGVGRIHEGECYIADWSVCAKYY